MARDSQVYKKVYDAEVNEEFHFDVLDAGGAVALLLLEVSLNLNKVGFVPGTGMVKSIHHGHHGRVGGT